LISTFLLSMFFQENLMFKSFFPFILVFTIGYIANH
jgi:hypothetical protein